MGGFSLRGKLNTPWKEKDFMATLDIDFNCMCLFVTGDDPDLVHVLLPNTAGHQQHVVRMVFQDPGDNTVTDRDMTGWALELQGAGPARQRQSGRSPVQRLREDSRIVDLTEVTGNEVDPGLVAGEDPGGKVVSRITIRGGELERVRAQDPVEDENLWVVQGREHVMAHQTTWRIRNVPDQLKWTRFGEGAAAIPLEFLKEVRPEEGNGNGDAHYRLRVYHVLDTDLPDSADEKEAILLGENVMHHFRAYYPLVNVPHPRADLVPSRPADRGQGGEPPAGVHYCKNAQARM